MKKLSMFFVVGALALLAGCASRMSGSTTTVCEDAPSTLSTSASGVETVVTIEGYDEDIIIWTEHTTFDRETYERYFWRTTGLLDTDIQAWFNSSQNNSPAGMTWNLVSVGEDTVVTELIYDYTELTDATLRQMWPGVTDFEREVTLTSAIAGLESRGANCN